MVAAVIDADGEVVVATSSTQVVVVATSLTLVVVVAMSSMQVGH